MKQIFSQEKYNKFKELLNIKENPSENDLFLIEKTKKYIKFIKWIPFLKMVGIGNTISMNASNENSDIDLYIVTGKNSIWFVRILVTFIFQILGVRKNEKKHKARFCLSFFSTLKGMDFSSFALENDIYLYFRIIYFKPILNYDNTYEKFIEINSTWADFSEYNDIIKENKKYITYKKNRVNTGFTPTKLILNLIENIFKKLFLPKTLKHYEKIGKPYGVIINDDLLKFHNNDRRKEVKKIILFY